MSDVNRQNRLRGKYRQCLQQPIDNPEVPEKKDWWSEICKSHGEKNYWDKDENKKTN
tara:strand:+ start:553 stop:723 length:171 start_codon:yes stop_codon:yes gene_type:complete